MIDYKLIIILALSIVILYLFNKNKTLNSKLIANSKISEKENEYFSNIYNNDENIEKEEEEEEEEEDNLDLDLLDNLITYSNESKNNSQELNNILDIISEEKYNIILDTSNCNENICELHDTTSNNNNFDSNVITSETNKFVEIKENSENLKTSENVLHSNLDLNVITSETSKSEKIKENSEKLQTTDNILHSNLDLNVITSETSKSEKIKENSEKLKTNENVLHSNSVEKSIEKYSEIKFSNQNNKLNEIISMEMEMDILNLDKEIPYDINNLEDLKKFLNKKISKIKLKEIQKFAQEFNIELINGKKKKKTKNELWNELSSKI